MCPDSAAFSPTGKTKVRRLAKRAVWDREAVYGVLDAGLACHVGYVLDGQPYVTPTGYARVGDSVVWHGSSASKMLRRLVEGVPVCFTVSLLDGIVHARSGFNSSFNYRSVMAFGVAREIVASDEKATALEAIVERITPGRWAELRPMTAQELKATKVLSLRLEEVACKIRTGGPNDEEADYAHPIWAGEVPIRQVLGEPVDDARLEPGIARPAYLKETRLG